jgi:hypothetical protein
VKSRRPGSHTLREKPVLAPERFEDLHRPRVHHSCAVPAPRSVERVDEQARHVAPLQLACQQQPGRAGANHKHLWTRIAHLRPRRRSHESSRSPAFLAAQVQREATEERPYRSDDRPQWRFRR